MARTGLRRALDSSYDAVLRFVAFSWCRRSRHRVRPDRAHQPGRVRATARAGLLAAMRDGCAHGVRPGAKPGAYNRPPLSGV
ncbi:hypothetical protein [Streptomyces sannanensis]|uniref:hypothetical protein n=1 Tax=Streptomyces sannanensis TaxID=285536 RepID=UPI0031E7D346